MTLKLRQHLLGLLAAVGLAASGTFAMFVSPQSVPVERIIANLTAFTKDHPEDAAGFYSLGRAHSLAFTRGVDRLPAYGSSGNDKPPFRVIDASMPSAGPTEANTKDVPNALSQEQTVAHLASGIRSFEKALELKPDESLQAMSLAFLLEKGTPQSSLVDFVPGVRVSPEGAESTAAKELLRQFQMLDEPNAQKPNLSAEKLDIESVAAIWSKRRSFGPNARELIERTVQTYWTRLATRTYLQAFRLAVPEEVDGQKDKHRGMFLGYRELVTYQAGEAFLRLAKEPVNSDLPKADITEVTAGIAKAKKVERGMAITPIVFSIAGAEPLDALVNPSARVRFDLDGSGLPTEWEWVRPQTGILVWDPEGKGKIESGRQLFGNATWWLMFENGYRALDALDDDRNGELADNELRGLALWFDSNSDGASSSAEVVSVESAGIAGLSVRPSNSDGEILSSPSGLRMRDGRLLPTYDWIARGTRVAASDSLAQVP